MIAVITGDLVKSVRLTTNQREKVVSQMELMALHLFGGANEMAIYRGDEFQVVVEEPALALRTALYLRSGLKSIQFLKKQRSPMADARMVIGMGDITFKSSNIGQSDGTAFQRSGRGLNKMSALESKILLKTGNQEIDAQWQVIFSLLDQVIDKWSLSSAQLLFALIEKDWILDAKDLEISKAALSQRKKHAGLRSIEHTLQYFESTFSKQWNF